MKEHQDVYYKLDLKNFFTQDFYYQAKKSYLQLIEKQGQASKKLFIDTLNFWDKTEYRWATAFTKNLHRVSQSILAEVAQASKATRENKTLYMLTYLIRKDWIHSS